MARRTRAPGDDAVSPTIGVVLLIGIATALMASIGLFVLGFGPGGQAPHGEFLFSQEEAADGASQVNVTITFAGGEDVVGEDLDVIVNSERACYQDGPFESPMRPGDEVTIVGYGDCAGSPEYLAPEDTVRVVWRAPAGARTTVLGDYEVF